MTRRPSWSSATSGTASTSTRFDGSRLWKPFPDAQHNRLFLSDLRDPAHLATLKGIWTDPMALDPSRRSAKVTRDVAAHLAELARMFEARHDPQVVAGFLMRCIFTMFAEDVGALPHRIFTETLKTRWIDHPERFQPEVERLWQVMNQGGVFGFDAKLLKFNGGLFADARALPITDRKVLQRLLDAAACDWSEVEPAIFGTLLERALDPKERHRLGAHYTPRAYVERLVRPTLEAPCGRAGRPCARRCSSASGPWSTRRSRRWTRGRMTGRGRRSAGRRRCSPTRCTGAPRW
ncbi:MAG: hypothetical protein IPN17_23720 [Deltaproteobacteria bacterium]|nr:hypothetical protein [Deltaproteobacteria bacterium]